MAQLERQRWVERRVCCLCHAVCAVRCDVLLCRCGSHLVSHIASATTVDRCHRQVHSVCYCVLQGCVVLFLRALAFARAAAVWELKTTIELLVVKSVLWCLCCPVGNCCRRDVVGSFFNGTLKYSCSLRRGIVWLCYLRKGAVYDIQVRGYRVFMESIAPETNCDGGAM